LLLLAVFGAVAWPLFAWVAAQLLIVEAEVLAPDAIVVLSGSSTYIERADWAAKLYSRNRAPLIILTDDKIISGWDRIEERNPFFYELSAREMQKRGVPAERIAVVSEPALGTYYESLNVCEYATTHKFRKLLVVTSAYHSRRALWSMRHACERSQIEIGVSAPDPGWQTPSPWKWWMGRWGWKVVGVEYVKLIYYWIRY
jgi:uncharacterized SAM-binding protein YcdF (DUF218 family)